jgi:hypothetical protein
MVKEKILMPEGYTVNSDSSLENYVKFATELYEKKKYITFNYKLGKPRTIKQNTAIWAFCEDIATKCNNAGYEMQTTSPLLKHSIETPWTARSVMDKLWMAVQRAMYPNKIESSSELDTWEVAPVADTLTRHLGEVHGIGVLFAKQAMDKGV